MSAPMRVEIHLVNAAGELTVVRVQATDDLNRRVASQLDTLREAVKDAQAYIRRTSATEKVMYRPGVWS